MDLILAQNKEKTIGIRKDSNENCLLLEIKTDKRHMLYRVSKKDMLGFLNGKVTAKDLYIDTACLEIKILDNGEEIIYPNEFYMEDLMEVPCADKKVNYSMFKNVKKFIKELK